MSDLSKLSPRSLGTPEDVAAVKRSYTGQFLKPVLARREPGRKKGIQAAE